MMALAMAFAAIAAMVVPATVAGATGDNGVLYNSIISPVPGNLPSQPFQAQQTSEFGNQITLTEPAGRLRTVVVTMSSWACQSGAWSTNDCSTDPGAKFTEPITLNIYNVPTSTSFPRPGSLIATITKTFSIPYRPSASEKCTDLGFPGRWFDGKRGCFNGKAVNITFNFSPLHVTLPQDIVFGIAYNTSQYGYHPYGALPCEATAAGCPYDSLNVALSQDPTNLTRGSDPNVGKVFFNTATASLYCDGGAAGSGFFRLDSPSAPSCWGVNTPGTNAPFYIPAVRFNGGADSGGADSGGDGGADSGSVDGEG
jgi:hypothetical protein